MGTRFIIIITTVAAGLLLTACGDDEPLTKAEFIEQADAICAATNAEAEPIFDAVWSGFTDEDFEDPAQESSIFQRWADAMDQLRPVFEEQLDDIGDLEPPAEDAEFVSGIVEEQRVALADFGQMVDDAADGDPAAMAAMGSDDSSDDPFDDINRRLREYGLEVCGDDG